MHSSPHSEDPVPAHRAVLDAVRDRDPQAAETAMRALLDQAGRDLDRIDGPDDLRDPDDTASERQAPDDTEGTGGQ